MSKKEDNETAIWLGIMALTFIFSYIGFVTIIQLEAYRVILIAASMLVAEGIYLKYGAKKYGKAEKEWCGDIGKFAYASLSKLLCWFVGLAFIGVGIVVVAIGDFMIKNYSAIIKSLSELANTIYPYIGFLGIILIWFYVNSLRVKEVKAGRPKK
jgi:hypothetical protein